MKRALWTSLTVAGIAAGCLLLSGLARAGDPPPAKAPAMPTPQKKIDHPLAKALDGAWSVASTSSMGSSTGTTKFALGVGGTVMLQDYEANMGSMGTFYGHGVWKFADDGKSIQGWWIDVHSAEMQHFAGTLTDTGYDVKDEQSGIRLTLAKKDATFVFELHQPDGGVMFTDTYTKK